MRKHFLILMLMALLPLAGFAADIQDVDFVAKNVVYGASNTANDLVEAPTSFSSYEVSAKFCDANKVELDVTNTKDLDAGTYYVKINGTGSYAPTTGYFKFIVAKRDLEGATVAAFDAKDFTGQALEYADADFTGKVTFATPALTLVKGTDYTVSYAANTNASTTAPTITFTAKEGGNYTGSITKTFTIKPVTLVLDPDDDACNATATLVKNSYTYNGVAQETGVNVVAKEGAPTLTTNDYAITYTATEGATTNAGTYKVYIQGQNNWYSAAPIEVGTVTINQATLFVEANATRAYDGAKGWSTLTKNNIDFTYVGWQGNDEEKYTAATPTIIIDIDWTDGESTDEALSNVLTLQDATIKNALAETHISIDEDQFNFTGTNNYKIKGKSTGKLTIAKKTGLTLTFNAEITKDKGETTTLDEVKAVLTTNAIEADRDAVKAAVTAFEIGTEADENGKYAITLTVNTDAAVFANYDMTAFVAGTGKIKYNNATLYVSLKTASLSKLTKVYDGTEPDLTAISAADFDIDGWVAGEQTALTITAQFTTEGEHKNVANYPVNFNVTGVPAGYDLEVSAATYKVTKRPIVFAIATQYLADGAIVSGDNSVFDNTLFTVSKETNNPASGLADEADKAAFALDLQDNFKNGTDPVKFKANGATELIPLTKAIKVVVVDGALANNYSWTETFGVVNIAGGATLVLDEKADLTAVTTTEPVTINFANARTLKPKRWYAMCLPFETTVAKISQAFGYAIVDVLPENATGLNFKIAMGKIEAYRPFLVKIADAPGLTPNDGDVDMNDGAKVKFTGVTIAAYNAEANPYFVQEAGEHYFKGTMKWDTIGQTYWTTGDKMANDAFEFDGYAGTTKLKALRAYIVGKTSTTSAPMITIEEADGSTTAINCINADGEAIEANGWYTINGIKLQGVPTEKGIYIHNGKKLVVK
jgi:hypothetical protein